MSYGEIMTMISIHDVPVGLFYIDPGSGSMLVQVVIAFFLGASITFRKAIHGAWLKVIRRRQRH